MKLLYLQLNPLTGKAANTTQVLNMCNAFRKLGIDVTLALPKAGGRLKNKEIIEREIGIPVNFKIEEYQKFTIMGRPMSLGAYWGMKSILDKSKDYDYCYTKNFFPARLAVKRKFKTICEQHDDRLHPMGLMNGKYVERFLKVIDSPNFLKLVTITHALADVWRKRGVNSEKILVLPDGVDFDNYRMEKSRDEARSELRIETKKKIVVYAGSLYKDRGIENILRLAVSFPEVSFMVVGGPEREKLFYESQANKYGLTNLIFTGRVPHAKVKDYLFAADVLLMLLSWQVPTINICSPLKMFEYMAAGRIIVAQSFPAIREILIDGENALLADPNFYEDIERKLRHALSLDYPDDMAKKARYEALNNYSWQKRAESIIEALRPVPSKTETSEPIFEYKTQ